MNQIDRVRAIPLHQIELGDRRREEYGDIDKLAASIKKIGLLHPVIVERIGDDQFRVVVGGRRLRAMQMLKLDTVPARLSEMLNDEQLREIEMEENEHRKDFTHGERGRTFKAALQTVADAEKVAAVISAERAEIKTATNPKGAGRKPKHGVARKDIAAALGTAETNIRESEQHVETAKQYPFMQGDDWRESHVFEARSIIQRLDPEEQQCVAAVIEGTGLLHPKHALEVLNNLVNLPREERAAMYKLSQSEDSRDRNLELHDRIAERQRQATGIAEMPAQPQPDDDQPPLRQRTAEERNFLDVTVNRLPQSQRARIYRWSRSEDSRDRDLAFTLVAGRFLTQATKGLQKAAKVMPADPDITAAADLVRNVHKRIDKVIRSAEQGRKQRRKPQIEPTAEFESGLSINPQQASSACDVGTEEEATHPRWE
jgi:ParB/RepB/Spo0J family partition protein